MVESKYNILSGVHIAINQITYLKLKKKFDTFLFIIKRFIYKKAEKISKKKTMLSIKHSLIIEVLKHIVKNIILFLFLFYIDGIIYNIFSLRLKLDDNLLSDILIAMTGIAGVFLGLYCSYISSIFSSKYSNCPKVMADLFENDLITDRSIKSIINYIIFSLIIIISIICSINIGISIIFVNILMGIYMIVSYIHIGKRILRMSDTYFVSNCIYNQLKNHIKRVALPHPFAKDETMQDNLRRFSQESINNLKTINKYNINSIENKGISILELMHKNIIVISEYLEYKPYIPYDSHWYKGTEYRKWFTASDHEIQIALRTGTFINSKNTSDKYWFEDRFLQLNQECLNKLINTNSIEEIIQYISLLEYIIQPAVESDSIIFFTESFETLQNILIEYLLKNNEEIYKLGLAEQIIYLYISIIVKINIFIKDLDIDNIISKLSNSNNKTKYYQFTNQADTQTLFKQIYAEKKIEKKIITPEWFIKQNIAKNIYNQILGFLKSIDIITNKYTINFANSLFEKKEYACSALVFSKYLELHNKTVNVLTSLNEIIKKLKMYHKETKNYIWDQYDIVKLQNNLSANFNSIPVNWSKCASIFTLEHFNEHNNYPDFLGLCYNHTCNFLIRSIANNDYESFKNAYKCLWSMVSIYQEISRNELLRIKEPYKQDAIIAVLCNPVIEFGYISGYAFLWGELSNNNIWKSLITNSFSEIVKKFSDASVNLCIQIKNLLSIPNSLRPAIYNRSVIHTEWKMIIESAFINSGFIEWERQHFYETIKTNSKLLKQAIGIKSDYKLLSIESYEIFAIYILNEYLSEENKYKSKTGWENEV